MSAGVAAAISAVEREIDYAHAVMNDGYLRLGELHETLRILQRLQGPPIAGRVPSIATDEAEGAGPPPPAPSAPPTADTLECEHCGREFEKEHGLRMHRAKAHPVSGAPFDPDAARARAARAI